ncbi:MAG: Rne/Rng family ribonuclease [Planctomycetes bacterium]|nr:Rne/Rng family ribonuclease [Planctomycetota bacterium]
MKRMLINATDPEESRIAVVENGVLQELHVEVAGREAYLGNIYKGRVVNIEPSIGAAFVAFGGRTNGFLHASDVLPAYANDDFRLEDVISGRARVSGDEGPDSVRAALDDDEDDDAGDDGAPPTAAARAAAAEERADADGGEPVEGDDDDAGPDDRDEVWDPRTHDFGAEAFAADDLDLDEDVDEGDGAASTAVDARRADGGRDDGEPEDAEPADDERDLAAAADADLRDAGGLDDDGGGDDDERAVDEDGAALVDGGAVEGGAAAGPRSRRQGSRARRKKRPRTKVPIDRLVRKGQELIVQVTKEGIGAKGPALTTYVSLPGRSLVLMPSLPKCGVSRKIDDPKERRRLKRIVRELDETGNGGVGFIVRTNGIEKSKAELQRDRDYLKKIWELVGHRVSVTRAPALLYQESDLVLKAMRDLFSPDIDEVVVDSKDVFLRIKDFAEKLMPHMAERIKLHELVTPLFHSFGIEQDVEKLYQPRVELPNGGSIVIEQAEALVAIDVNSGRFKPGTDLEETAYRTNLEAIPEIVRQLRLRDLGGLIMIDFIDMSADKHRRAVERKIIDGLKGDRARIKVGRISPFGMLELTRQRVGPGLKRTVFTTCRHCSGSGLVRTVQSKALAVMREVRALLNLKGYSILQVFVAPPVNDYLVNYKRRQILEIEESVGRTILFKAEPSYPVEAVHYRFMTGDGQEARVAIPAGLGVRA